MRSIASLVLALLLAIPLAASAQEPLVVIDLGFEGDTRSIEARETVESTEEAGGIVRTTIVGSFVWLEWGEADREVDSQSDNIVSVDVSDPTITQVKAYADGTVELVREQPEPKPTPEPQPEPEEVDVTEEYPEIDWGQLLHLLKHV